MATVKSSAGGTFTSWNWYVPVASSSASPTSMM